MMRHKANMTKCRSITYNYTDFFYEYNRFENLNSISRNINE